MKYTFLGDYLKGRRAEGRISALKGRKFVQNVHTKRHNLRGQKIFFFNFLRFPRLYKDTCFTYTGTSSYDLVEFTLDLVGDTIRKSAIRPLKNGPRAHKSQLFNPQSFLHHGIIYCEDWNATAFLQYLDFQLYNNWMKEWKTNNCIISD